MAGSIVKSTTTTINEIDHWWNEIIIINYNESFLCAHQSFLRWISRYFIVNASNALAAAIILSIFFYRAHIKWANDKWDGRQWKCVMRIRWVAMGMRKSFGFLLRLGFIPCLFSWCDHQHRPWYQNQIQINSSVYKSKSHRNWFKYNGEWKQPFWCKCFTNRSICL